MSHVISVHSVEEQIFLLSQMASSSRAYVEALRTNFGYAKEEEWICSEFDYEFMRYQGHLESLVSDYLIQCATRTRIIQDSWKVDWDHGYDPDKEAYARYAHIARAVDGKVRLSIREVCNKIIHALRFELEYEGHELTGFSYWSGKCHLHGAQRGAPWHVELDVRQWCFALQHYYDVRE